THNQNILFPDGRHRLSFSNFRINILNRIVEFDSCTIVATKGDSSTNSFSIFFDKLQLTNIDFTTLYLNEIIKADSVYCINPRFRLDVSLEKRTGPAKALPKLNELIQELTGELQLAFVVVENGSFDINTMREGRPSSFTSDHNNFELQGLQIKKSNPQPLTVEKFAMAIRNYETFLRDSSFSIQFDSILLNNNRVSLSNFTYQELQNNKVTNSLRMPQFELQGLSWDDLVFDQKLNAKKVTLYRPVIDYKFTASKRTGTQDIFQTLAGIGNFMQLENLDVSNGQINLIFKNNARLQLENANLSVMGKQLVDARKIQNIQRSVTALFFKKGNFKMGDVTANLTNVNFTGGGGNNQLHAGNIQVKNKNNLDINAQSVAIRSMIVNDDIHHTSISGISWEKADIKLSSFSNKKNKKAAIFTLRDIKGANTKIVAADGNKKLSFFLQNLKADEVSSTANRKPTISGLAANGNDFHFENGLSALTIKILALADHQLSTFENISYKNKTPADSIKIQIPKLEITPDINAIIKGKINAELVRITNPFADITITKNNNPESKWPEAKIGKLIILEPALQFTQTNEKAVSKLNWDGQGKVFELSDLSVSSLPSKRISAEKLQLSLNKFIYSNSNGKTFDAGDGKLEAELSKLELQPGEAGILEWKGIINYLDAKNFIIDSLGKKAGKLSIESARLNNLSISSTTLLYPRELVSRNKAFRLDNVTGSYHNATNRFNWYNTAYDKNTKIFSTDSFFYRPTLDKKTFIAESRYQTDYMTLKTGALTIGPFDIDRYIKDSILEMGDVSISNVLLTDFRDKRKPRKQGDIRLLPVDMLKKIPVHLLVDAIRLNNAHVEYEEWNEKTNKAGKITVARLNGRITQVRNYDLKKTDSLHIRVSGFIENSILTKLVVKESYTDSLGGFLMTVQMGPAGLMVLNPILRPLASAEIRSGQLDTLTMRVIGREQMAFGEISMYYHDLKVNLLTKGNRNKKSLFSGLKTFLVNSIVKNKNTDKSRPVFFIRLRDRSAVNYLVKITMNGILNTAIGKKSKKQFRKHEKETKKRNLPPVENL
ncbi:MAG: hypothetical protein ACXWWC_11420, partial [Chitinophagaceae bacterium]